jgi:beta-1,4-mannosyltransferase
MSTTAPARERIQPPRTSSGVLAGSRTRIASLPPVLPTNPYQRLLYAELARAGMELEPRPKLKISWLWRHRRSVGLLHFHWPEAYYRYGGRPLHGLTSWPLLVLFGLRLGAARMLGYRIAWTIHQVQPHESASASLERIGGRLLARASDVLLAHDEATAELARSTLRVADVVVVPHGSYAGVYPAGRSRAAVRKELGVAQDAFTFLCFGDLRAYKDVGLLLSAFGAAAVGDAALVVAGSDRATGGAVLATAETDARVRPLIGFVPDERVAELFAAADVAVLARGDGGTSGSLVLAMSMGVPVVAARRPAYEAVTAGGAAGWLFEPGDEASLASALAAAASATAEERREKGGLARRQVERARWPEIAARTAALLRGEAAA